MNIARSGLDAILRHIKELRKPTISEANDRALVYDGFMAMLDSVYIGNTTSSARFHLHEGLEPPSVEEDRQGLSKGFWIACLGIPTLAVTAAWFTSLYYKFKSRKRG